MAAAGVGGATGRAAADAADSAAELPGTDGADGREVAAPAAEVELGPEPALGSGPALAGVVAAQWATS